MSEKLSNKWEAKAEDYANRAGKAGPGSFFHESNRLCQEAEQDIATLEAELALLMGALTRNGALTSHHLRAWAEAVRGQNGYGGANLEVWLLAVADAMNPAKEQADE
jgi:hypothetical protein